MDIEIVQQLLAMVAAAGEGAFWLIIVYFVMEYIIPCITWIAVLITVFCIIRHICYTASIEGGVKEVCRVIGYEWSSDMDAGWNIKQLRRHIQLYYKK